MMARTMFGIQAGPAGCCEPTSHQDCLPCRPPQPLSRPRADAPHGIVGPNLGILQIEQIQPGRRVVLRRVALIFAKTVRPRVELRTPGSLEINPAAGPQSGNADKSNTAAHHGRAHPQVASPFPHHATQSLQPRLRSDVLHRPGDSTPEASDAPCTGYAAFPQSG